MSERSPAFIHLPPVTIIADYKTANEDPERGTLTDAERYRILVAWTMRQGGVASKADFDHHVSRMGTLAAADELLKLSTKRYGCRAYRLGKTFTCDCGASWLATAENPPACRAPDTSTPRKQL